MQKLLASVGIASRRKIEELIANGEVLVNGKVAVLGDKISTSDKVVVSGKVIRLNSSKAHQLKVLAYNKPAGEVCTTSDPEGRPSVFAALPRVSGARWISIGRLDFNTTGLLLFTNDGNFANELMHPRNNYEREYAVRVRGDVKASHLEMLLQGVRLEDGVAKCKKVWAVGGENSNKWYHMILTEGRYREVRRMWEALGFTVSRLTRVRFGGFYLPRTLAMGKTRFLTAAEISLLKGN